MTDRNKVLEMIAKMSRLTEDTGAFQGEASAAAAKIQELMEKYAISQVDVQNFKANQQEKEFKQAFTSQQSEFKHKNIQEWEWRLARLISTITLTRHYSTGIGNHRWSSGKYGAHMVFFGVEENAKTAAELYTLWHENIYKMAKRAQTLNVQRILKEYKMPDPLRHYADDHPDDDPRYYRASWISACLREMHNKVYEEQKQRESGKTVSSIPGSALVLYKSEVDKAYREMSEGFRHVNNSGSKGYSTSGHRDGKETGSKIRIGSKQLGDE